MYLAHLSPSKWRRPLPSAFQAYSHGDAGVEMRLFFFSHDAFVAASGCILDMTLPEALPLFGYPGWAGISTPCLDACDPGSGQCDGEESIHVVGSEGCDAWPRPGVCERADREVAPERKSASTGRMNQSRIRSKRRPPRHTHLTLEGSVAGRGQEGLPVSR